MRQARRRSCGRFFGLHFLRSRLPGALLKAGRCLKNQYLDSYCSPSVTGRICLRRAAPAFEILMLAPVRRFFPEPRQRLNGCWRRSRVLHPSEDLSELPPLRSVVAGQEYHCPRTRSLRGSLPKLLLDGWVPLVTSLGRLYTKNLYRWSSRILRIAVPFLARPLDVMSVAGYVLFKLHESVF